MAVARVLPVILCGKTERIGASVIETLKPEYEVVHMILDPAAGVAQIPLLLSGKSAPSESSLGTKNYSQPPVAVFTGAGYDDTEIEEMMKASDGEQVRQVPWLRPDTTKPTPPLGPEYGAAMVHRIKRAMDELQKDGEMGAARAASRIVWY